jgi:hypothetical protein
VYSSLSSPPGVRVRVRMVRVRVRVRILVVRVRMWVRGRVRVRVRVGRTKMGQEGVEKGGIRRKGRSEILHRVTLFQQICTGAFFRFLKRK